MNFIFQFILVCLIITLFILGILYFEFILKNKFIKNIIKEKSTYSANAEEAFKLLDYLIDREFSFIIELPFEGRDIKRITDFESNLVELTKAVTDDITPLFIARCKNLGVSEDFIYSYITRNCTIKLLNYMKENNGGMVKNNNEEE